MSNPPSSPAVLRALSHPGFYFAGSVLGLVGFALVWIKDESYLYVVLGAAAYGTFTWFRKRRVPDNRAGQDKL
jgi:4-hydroxybenzoate polyprenyltransferase